MPVSDVDLVDHMDSCTTEYAKYAVQERALPQSDGLKPVQRRILWVGHNMGLSPKKYIKSANVAGATLSYHPHGDTAVYGAMVSMTHARYPLMKGQGNFGSPFGDKAGAARYTEISMSALGVEALSQVMTAEMKPSYDGTNKEPIGIPTPLPLLLMNGSSGIGVGTKTDIPPHNLYEVLTAAIAMVKDSSSNPSDYVKGPDPGAGVLISTAQAIRNLYSTGKGTFKYCCDHTVSSQKGQFEILVTGLAPGWNYERFAQKAVEMGAVVENQSSSDDGIRISITGHIGRTQQIQELLKTSHSYSLNTVNGDEILERRSLSDILKSFLVQRTNTVVRQYTLNRESLLAKVSVLDARIWGVQNSDALRELQGMTSEAAAVDYLVKKGLTKDQANLLLSTPLRRLLRFNLESLTEERDSLVTKADTAKAIIASPDSEVIRQLQSALDSFGDKRGTQIMTQEEWDKAHFLPGSEPMPSIVGVKLGTFFIGSTSVPSIVDKPSYVCVAKDSALLVGSSGYVARYDKFGLPKGKDGIPADLIALVGDAGDCVVFIDSTGRYCIAPQASWKVGSEHKSAFKVKSTVSDALMANTGDTLLFEMASGEIVERSVKPSKKSAKGQVWANPPKGKVKGVMVKPKDSMAVSTSTGAPLSSITSLKSVRFRPGVGEGWVVVTPRGKIMPRSAVKGNVRVLFC